MEVGFPQELEYLFAKWYEVFEEALKDRKFSEREFKNKNPNFFFGYIQSSRRCARRLLESNRKLFHRGGNLLSKSVIVLEKMFKVKDSNLLIACHSFGKGTKSIWLSYGLQGQIDKLKNVKTVAITKRGNEYFAHFNCEVVVKPTLKLEEVQSFLGIDRGIKNVAVAVLCSKDGAPMHNPWYFGGGQIVQRKLSLRDMRQIYGQLRRLDKVKETRDRETNFVKDINHKISRQIVDIAVQNHSVIVLEDLKGIRNSVVNWGKQSNYLKSSWSYAQLEFMIEYKAGELGVPVLYLNPRNTSKTCSKCGQIGDRRGLWFSCNKCGYQYNADANAALNVAKLGREQILHSSCAMEKGVADMPMGG
jgi:IS605 OrfB family transposase